MSLSLSLCKINKLKKITHKCPWLEKVESLLPVCLSGIGLPCGYLAVLYISPSQYITGPPILYGCSEDLILVLKRKFQCLECNQLYYELDSICFDVNTSKFDQSAFQLLSDINSRKKSFE